MKDSIANDLFPYTLLVFTFGTIIGAMSNAPPLATAHPLLSGTLVVCGLCLLLISIIGVYVRLYRKLKE